MNQTGEVPVTKSEEAIGVTIKHSFPESELPIFWGPNQNTSLGLYIEPSGWQTDALLAMPRVVRFNYDSFVVDTADYATPPPPPPPPTDSKTAWLVLQTSPHTFSPSCPDGSYGLNMVWGKLVSYGGGPGKLAQVRTIHCCASPDNCGCYPDCNWGFSHADYEPYIYDYPCGDFFPVPPNTASLASGCPEIMTVGFPGSILAPSYWTGNPIPEWP